MVEMIWKSSKLEGNLESSLGQTRSCHFGNDAEETVRNADGRSDITKVIADNWSLFEIDLNLLMGNCHPRSVLIVPKGSNQRCHA